jgi:hypothetical protein
MHTASEWKEKAAQAARQGAVELDLPSGMKILARRPGPGDLAVWGGLPLSLASAADKKTDPASMSDQDVLDTAGFMRDLLVYCVIEPRISLSPGPEEIHPRDIPSEDWQFIVQWAMRAEEARGLESFRGRRSDAGDSGDGQSVLDQTF